MASVDIYQLTSLKKFRFIILNLHLAVFQAQCATSTLMSVPSTPVTTGAHALTASTASLAFAQRGTTTPPVYLRWTNVAVTPASTADARTSSMGKQRLNVDDDRAAKQKSSNH